MSEIKAHALIKTGRGPQGDYHAVLTIHGLGTEHEAIVMSEVLRSLLEESCGAQMQMIPSC
jgi:hypothetical protein